MRNINNFFSLHSLLLFMHCFIPYAFIQYMNLLKSIYGLYNVHWMVYETS